jgi:hypothetical protein
MFSEPDETIVDYTKRSQWKRTSHQFPTSLRSQYARDILMSSFMVIRNNCEEACSQRVLADLSEEKKDEYRKNSKIGQQALRTILNDDPVMQSLDSCIRRCFGKFLK